MSTTADPASEKFHIDKRVPVALIFSIVIALGGQTVGALLWANKMDYRVSALEVDIEKSKSDTLRLSVLESQYSIMSNNMAVSADNATRLSVLESQYNDIKEALRRIEAKLVGPRPTE